MSYGSKGRLTSILALILAIFLVLETSGEESLQELGDRRDFAEFATLQFVNPGLPQTVWDPLKNLKGYEPLNEHTVPSQWVSSSSKKLIPLPKNERMQRLALRLQQLKGSVYSGVVLENGSIKVDSRIGSGAIQYRWRLPSSDSKRPMLLALNFTNNLRPRDYVCLFGRELVLELRYEHELSNENGEQVCKSYRRSLSLNGKTLYTIEEEAPSPHFVHYLPVPALGTSLSGVHAASIQINDSPKRRVKYIQAGLVSKVRKNKKNRRVSLDDDFRTLDLFWDYGIEEKLALETSWLFSSGKTNLKGKGSEIVYKKSEAGKHHIAKYTAPHPLKVDLPSYEVTTLGAGLSIARSNTKESGSLASGDLRIELSAEVFVLSPSSSAQSANWRVWISKKGKRLFSVASGGGPLIKASWDGLIDGKPDPDFRSASFSAGASVCGDSYKAPEPWFKDWWESL